jgi:hypothetical protein
LSGDFGADGPRKRAGRERRTALLAVLGIQNRMGIEKISALRTAFE